MQDQSGGFADEPTGSVSRESLTKYAWLSIAAAITTITLKSAAYAITGSVGLLSDALESTVNLVAAILALVVLTIAAKPADEEHHFGHGKAEYFSAGAEGLMIFIAAAAIIVSALERLIHPQPIEQAAIGLVVTGVASVINFLVAVVLIREGRRHRSVTLVADGKHLMTDVWTSIGVIGGVAAVAITGWERLDPLIAIAVGINIVFTGVKLIRSSTAGLMDVALSPQDTARIEGVLDRHRSDTIQFHALRTRESGHHRFITMHVLVPGAWTVQQGHDFVEALERELSEALPGSTVTSHLEPIEDPVSYNDIPLGDERWQ